MKNNYIKPYIPFFEDQDDIKVGDQISFGKFKNKRATVTGFGIDKNNQPTIITDKGEMSLYHVRIDKLMNEDLHLSDFKHHQATSDFTKDWIEVRRKIKGPANKSAKIHSMRVNRSKDYIIFVFKSKPTYDSKAQSVDVKSMIMNGNVNAYTQEIKVEGIFSLLKTKPEYNVQKLTIDEIREALNVCAIRVSCNCPAETFQGLSYYLTQIDGAIYPNNVKPKRWNKYHDKDSDTGFVCKHLSLITNQIEFFLTNFTSMINSYLKKH